MITYQESDSKKMGIVITPSLNNYFILQDAEGSYLAEGSYSKAAQGCF